MLDVSSRVVLFFTYLKPENDPAPCGATRDPLGSRRHGGRQNRSSSGPWMRDADDLVRCLCWVDGRTVEGGMFVER